MDLNKTVQEISDKVIDEKLPEIIEKQITESLKDIVSDCFRSYSDFGKKLKEAVEEKTNVSLKNLKLNDYSEFIVKAIETNISCANEQILTGIKERVSNIVGLADVKEIKISSLIEELTNQLAKEDFGDNSGEISFHCIYNERHKWHSIFCDPEPDKEPKECKLEFLISSDGGNKGKAFLFKYNDTWSYQLSELTPAALSRIDGFELYLFRLINSDVTFIIDPEDVETSWYKYDDY